MNKINSIVWGFCGDNGTAIVDELRKFINIQMWFSDNAEAIDINCILQGNFPQFNKVDSSATRRFEMFYKRSFNEFCIMINRRGLIFSDIHELTNEFAIAYYYYFSIYKINRPDVVIFANIPHEGPDYIMYYVAKLLNIKTLICYQNILRNQFLMTTSIADFGLFESIPKIFNHSLALIGEGYAQELVNMNDIQKQQMKNHTRGLKRFRSNLTEFLWH